MVVLVESASEFEPMAEGVHKGRCFASVDLGTQKNEYNGEIKFQRKIRLSWESYTDKREDGTPNTISRNFTYSLFQNAGLVKTLKPWLKDELRNGFDTDSLVGRPCQFLVEHNQSQDGTKTYANLTKAMPLDEKEAEAQHNNPLRFSLDAFDKGVFDSLPEWMQEIIAASPEYAKATGSAPVESVETGALTQNELNDSIPF